MKKVLLAIAAVFATSAAYADGFVCETQDGVLKAQVYNHVAAAEGTRTPAIMILSDNSVQDGRKTIATFDANETLSGGTSSFVANVDLRYRNSNRKGEYLLGTRLGEVDVITLDVDFTYAQTVANGDEVKGILTAAKRNGEVITSEVNCTRYLKN